MIIELKGINKDYYRDKTVVPVLRNIDLQIEKGDYVAIMGPSGSGKTTLMNLLGFLDCPTSGTYLFDGVEYDMHDDDKLAEVRNKYIGFVFQSFYLLPKMTAAENVALPLLYAGVSPRERRERAIKALEEVGLGDRTEFYPNQLSGGQCQRIAIARAMICKPSLLLADEPTGALDTASGAQIMELFSKLNDDGVTIVVITHEFSVADCALKTYHILDGVISNGLDREDELSITELLGAHADDENAQLALTEPESETAVAELADYEADGQELDAEFDEPEAGADAPEAQAEAADIDTEFEEAEAEEIDAEFEEAEAEEIDAEFEEAEAEIAIKAEFDNVSEQAESEAAEA